MLTNWQIQIGLYLFWALLGWGFGWLMGKKRYQRKRDYKGRFQAKRKKDLATIIHETTPGN